jgi:hypothetical protein
VSRSKRRSRRLDRGAARSNDARRNADDNKKMNVHRCAISIEVDPEAGISQVLILHDILYDQPFNACQ